jgi:hypothetical protein
MVARTSEIVGDSHKPNNIVGKLTINKTNFNKTMTQGFTHGGERRDSQPKLKGQRSHSNNVNGTYSEEPKKGAKAAHGRLQSSGNPSGNNAVYAGANPRETHASMDPI